MFRVLIRVACSLPLDRSVSRFCSADLSLSVSWFQVPLDWLHGQFLVMLHGAFLSLFRFVNGNAENSISEVNKLYALFYVALFRSQTSLQHELMNLKWQWTLMMFQHHTCNGSSHSLSLELSSHGWIYVEIGINVWSRVSQMYQRHYIWRVNQPIFRRMSQMFLHENFMDYSTLYLMYLWGTFMTEP